MNKIEIERDKTLSHLNPYFTFEVLLVDEHNRKAVDAVKDFVYQKESGIIILFSDGKQENGKTHLAQAAGHLFFDEMNSKCIYSTAESFVSYAINHALANAGKDGLTPFEKLYCQNDMNYILDDVHFLIHKEICAKYFKDWLNYCIKNGEKVIVTLANNPEQIEDEELRQVILSYPCYEIYVPTECFKEKYVVHQAKKEGVMITEDDIKCLAKKSFREIGCEIYLRKIGRMD